MDNLTYNYIAGTNKLDNVTDAVSGTPYGNDFASGQTAGNYSYDAIGNLIKDVKENITNIEWTVYGKIKRIVPTLNSNKPEIIFNYDASGNRISKTTFYPQQFPNNKTTTHYVRDAQGNVMATYEETGPTNGNYYYVLKEQHIYGSSRLGMATPNLQISPVPVVSNGNYYNRILGVKSFELNSHIGNVQTVISDKKIAVTLTSAPTLVQYFTPEIITANDFFVFGFEMKGRAVNSGANYLYGFNGKRKDTEGLGGGGSTYDYGFRIYNPSLGRFLSVDPLTKQFAHYTPYQFSGNSPIFFIDLDGAEETPHPKFKEFKFDFFEFFGFNSQSDLKEHHETNNAKVKADLSYKFEENKKRWNAWCNTAIKLKEVSMTAADLVLPVELANQLITGQNLDGTDATAGDIAINIIGVIPMGKVFKGGKILIKNADKFIDVTSDVFKLFEKANPCGCFTSGTKVLTKKGLVSIDSLKIGDVVISFNDSLKTYNKKKILSTLNYVRDSIYTFYLSNEIIKTTPDHPFYINQKWILARNIKQGDKLSTYNKSTINVDSIKLDILNTNVYNFIVEDDHTYFVSTNNILVHNGGPCDYLAKTLAAFTKSGNLIPKALREHISNSISDPTLKNAFNQMYRGTAKILSGRTADALRDEVAKGGKLGHLIKAQGFIKNLTTLIQTGTLNATDSKIANEILKDLKSAVKLAESVKK